MKGKCSNCGFLEEIFFSEDGKPYCETCYYTHGGGTLSDFILQEE